MEHWNVLSVLDITLFKMVFAILALIIARFVSMVVLALFVRLVMVNQVICHAFSVLVTA